MTARWRSVLRMRALLRLLLDSHVPLGALIRCVEQVKLISDEQLPNEQRQHLFTPTGGLARDIVNELLGDDVELIDTDRRPPGEPRDLLRIGDELRRRRLARSRAAEVAGGDRDRDAEDEHKAVALELDELLAFVGPLMGAPLPDLERFGAFLESERFYAAMQAYRHASLVPQGEVAAAFEAVKATLLEAVRR